MNLGMSCIRKKVKGIDAGVRGMLGGSNAKPGTQKMDPKKLANPMSSDRE